MNDELWPYGHQYAFLQPMLNRAGLQVLLDELVDQALGHPEGLPGLQPLPTLVVGMQKGFDLRRGGLVSCLWRQG